MKKLFLSIVMCMLALGFGCQEKKAAIKPGSLAIMSTPQGAAVMVNGKAEGMSPVTVTNLPPGSHLVKLSKPGFVDAVQSVNLVEGQSAPVDIIMEKVQGLLLVHSNPQGADITISGKFRGKTPIVLTDMELGRHSVSFNLSGFQPRETEVDVPDRTPRKLVMELVTDSGRLVLTSAPPGASVLLGGQDAGKTPMTLERLTAGTHELQFTLPGHRSITRSVSVQPGDDLGVQVDLVPIPGSVQFISIPADARVYVENQFRGKTPLTLEDLEPGSYRVRLEFEGFTPEARNITVQKAGHSTEEFRMTRNAGYFELVTEPAGVAVYINGKLVGETEATSTDVISNPMRIYTLEPGPHTLHLTRKGYGYQPRQFMITREAPVVLHEKLKRLFIPDTRVRLRDNPNTPIEGMLISREPNGDVELMVGASATRKISGLNILNIEPIRLEDVQP